MEYYQIYTEDGPMKVAPYELARDLELENKQLKARMADFQSLIIEGTSQMQWYHSGKKFLGVDYCKAAELINRKPAQSLTSIKAQTLREYADKNYVSIAIDDFDRGCNHAMWQMRKDAERIEKEAKK